MLHQGVRLQWISTELGYGLFAGEFIPKGTLTFVNDALDVTIDPKDPRFQREPYLSMLEKYSYSTQDGRQVLCWDFGKYMNHCCNPNSMTTGYGFDIAHTDIKPGEEITTDYGTFTLTHEMRMSCSKPNCRRVLDIKDFDACVPEWDRRIRSALAEFTNVTQPEGLSLLIDENTRKDLEAYLAGDESSYRSISTQKPQTPIKPADALLAPSIHHSFHQT